MLSLVEIDMNDLEESCLFLHGVEGLTVVTTAMSESSTVNTDATGLLDEHGQFCNQRHGIHALADCIYQISTSRRMKAPPFHPPRVDSDDSDDDASPDQWGCTARTNTVQWQLDDQ